MIKFILAVIAMIFVGLAAYVYMNPKETHAPVAKVAQKTERSIVKKETPSVEKETVSAKAEVVSEKKSSVKNITVKSPELVSHETNYEMVEMEDITKNSTLKNSQYEVADFSQIGRGLTLEKIKNSDVNDYEKEIMLDDLAAYQSYRGRNNPVISKEEGIKALMN